MNKSWQGRIFYCTADSPALVIQYLLKYKTHARWNNPDATPTLIMPVTETSIVIRNRTGTGIIMNVVIDSEDDWLMFNLRFPVAA